TLRIVGVIIDRVTRSGLEGLSVEAWRKDSRCPGPLERTDTDATGRFVIEIDAGFFGDRRPSIFFKVFRESQLIAHPAASVLRTAAPDESALTIPVADAAAPIPSAPVVAFQATAEAPPPMPTPAPTSTPYVVRGTVRYSDGRCVAGTKITAADRDLRT